MEDTWASSTDGPEPSISSDHVCKLLKETRVPVWVFPAAQRCLPWGTATVHAWCHVLGTTTRV